MLLQFASALINPAGRLSPVPFAFFAVVLAVAHIYAFGQIHRQGLGLTWNAYTIAVFAMLWMQFCILTRRSKDTGSSGIIYVPVLFIAATIFIITIDPDLVWPGLEHSAIGTMIADYGLKIVRGLYIALLIYGIRAAGMDGPNAYGPEFGDTFETTETKAKTAAGTPTAPAAKASAARKTPRANTQRPRGFGQRRREPARA